MHHFNLFYSFKFKHWLNNIILCAVSNVIFFVVVDSYIYIHSKITDYSSNKTKYNTRTILLLYLKLEFNQILCYIILDEKKEEIQFLNVSVFYENNCNVSKLHIFLKVIHITNAGYLNTSTTIKGVQKKIET